MNIIQSRPLKELGYNFIDKEHLQGDRDEYFFRNLKNNSITAIPHRSLTTPEIEILVNNRNTSDNWNMIYVTESFDATLVRNCKFFGLIRIGSLQPLYKEFHNLRTAVGLYNSTIISCDIGDNVCIDNVNYLSHYIIGNDVMIVNVNELATTDYAKFGNGIIKEGESEKNRVWIEVCNENGGRGIIPFNGMLPGDAYLWSRYRDDDTLQTSFRMLTEKKFDKQRGYYGMIGDRTVIKNSRIIKDTHIGSDAYIKGANKLKNLTINSDPERKSQIGEGCELVNGIIGYGCRIFYGVKAVRFHMASHSQLKYGARLINSYLGNNSTISCCEVLNTLIFPAHEQHHNNSFLCAALIMGQSNIAAGATIGSNHNSRSADGEIIAGRGFWPGLCVSLKHNSKFASFTIIAKGDYPSELEVPIPFSLILNDVAADQLLVMPAYWFMYNMYALARNAWKYKDRDKRTEKLQLIEYDYLAPDTINEIFTSLTYLKKLQPDEKGNAFVSDWENSHRKTRIAKIPKSIALFEELIRYYAAINLIEHLTTSGFKNFNELKKSLNAATTRVEWKNIGGQLIRTTEVNSLIKKIKNCSIQSWDEVHQFYREQGNAYTADKLQHAYVSYLEIENITAQQFTAEKFFELLDLMIHTKTWMSKSIYSSREKDYTSHFRKMVYETKAEMDKVIGELEDNSFLQMQFKELDEMTLEVKKIKAVFKM